MIPEEKLIAICDAIDAAREYVSDNDDARKLILNTMTAFAPMLFESHWLR